MQVSLSAKTLTLGEASATASIPGLSSPGDLVLTPDKVVQFDLERARASPWNECMKAILEFSRETATRAL